VSDSAESAGRPFTAAYLATSGWQGERTTWPSAELSGWLSVDRLPARQPPVDSNPLGSQRREYRIGSYLPRASFTVSGRSTANYEMVATSRLPDASSKPMTSF
jgi:hypothetical protein